MLLKPQLALDLLFDGDDEALINLNAEKAVKPIRSSKNKAKALTQTQMTLSFIVECEDDGLMGLVVEWDEQEMNYLRDSLIERSIQILRNKEATTSSFAEELAWIYSEDNPEHPFSIQTCCKAAGLDLEGLRLGLDRSLPEGKRMIIRLIDNGEYNTRRNQKKVV